VEHNLTLDVVINSRQQNLNLAKASLKVISQGQRSRSKVIKI